MTSLPITDPAVPEFTTLAIGDWFHIVQGATTLDGRISIANAKKVLGGVVWFNGTGVPSPGLGNDGDYYLQDNGVVWRKDSGTWTDTGINLKGPAGQDGQSTNWRGDWSAANTYAFQDVVLSNQGSGGDGNQYIAKQAVGPSATRPENDATNWDFHLAKGADGAGTGTVTSVAATAPAEGLTITGSPITVSGTFGFALANDLAAIEALTTFGLAERTGNDTWATVAITTFGKSLINTADAAAGRTVLDAQQFDATTMLGSIYDTNADGVVDAADILAPKVRAQEALAVNDLVGLDSFSAGLLNVKKASVSNDLVAYGIMLTTASLNDEINPAQTAIISGFDTSGREMGQAVYLADNGQFTYTRPTGTNLSQVVGWVAHVDAADGAIYFSPQPPDVLIGQNILYNPDFRHAQRGTTFTNPNGIYTLDRWVAVVQTGSSGVGVVKQSTFNLGDTDVPGSPTYYLNFDITTAPTIRPYIQQRIPNVRNFAGERVTFSMWARSSVAIQGTIRFRQNFGTGGSPSSDAITDSATLNIGTGWNRYEFSIDVPSIAGKTLGTNGNDFIGIEILTSANLVYSLDIAVARLARGMVTNDLEIIDKDLDLTRCKTFFRREINETVEWLGDGRTATSERVDVTLRYPEMRANPTITVSAPGHFVDHTNAVFTGFAVNNAKLRSASLLFTRTGAGYGTNQTYSVRSGGTAGVYLDVDAEL